MFMGKASVLVGFISKPDTVPKEFKILCNEGKEVSGWVNVNNMLSAKRESLYSSCRSRTPLISGWERIAAAWCHFVRGMAATNERQVGPGRWVWNIMLAGRGEKDHRNHNGIKWKA